MRFTNRTTIRPTSKCMGQSSHIFRCTYEYEYFLSKKIKRIPESQEQRKGQPNYI